MDDRGSAARWVAVGGGHGLSRTLRALNRLDARVTAVVNVADDGGSSGRLRRDYGIVPPGDLRMALACLVDDDLAAVLQHRWDGGDLDGHAMGNLLVHAFVSTAGMSMTDAFARVGDLLGARGRVVPCTESDVVLVAEDLDGGRTRGQVAIADSRGHRRVWLEPGDVPAVPAAVEAIRAADVVVLGPGSMFTSVLATLAVHGIAEAVRSSPARLVHVANMRQQPDETLGMDAAAHLDVLGDVLGRKIDVVVQHDGPEPVDHGPALGPLERHRYVGRFVTADLLDGEDGHDPAALAAVLETLLPD